jgi:hypothetical protein
MKTKICKKCEKEKNLCDFNKDKYSNDGLRYRCRQCTSEDYINFYYKNKESEILRQTNYQKQNTDNVNEKRRIRHKNRYKFDLLYKLKFNFRNRVKLFLKSKNFDIKSNNTFNIVGCTPEELRKHIENQFTEGMNWGNFKHDGWHIDHIIPLSNAKNEDEVYKLCHYTNLQPLWADENYKKSNKII